MKSSLGISDFFEEISSVSHSIIFLYFFALITKEGYLISPWHSLALPFFGTAIKTHLFQSCSQCLWRSFLYSFSVYSCHLFLISFASVRSIPFLFFIVTIFAWNVPLVSLIMKRSLVFSSLLFSSISLHWSLRKAFLSLLAILWNSVFRWVYLSFFHLSFTSLFSAICKAYSDNHFALLNFFFLGMVLITASCTMSQTSVHSSSGTLSIRSISLNLFVTSIV